MVHVAVCEAPGTHLVCVWFDAPDEVRVGRAQGGHQGVQRVLEKQEHSYFLLSIILLSSTDSTFNLYFY